MRRLDALGLLVMASDSSVLAGLSHVSMKRGDLDRAEVLAREAITVAPEYEIAREDLQPIEDLRIEQQR